MLDDDPEVVLSRRFCHLSKEEEEGACLQDEDEGFANEDDDISDEVEAHAVDDERKGISLP